MTPTLPILPAPTLPDVTTHQLAAKAAQGLQGNLAAMSAPQIGTPSLGSPSLPAISAPVLPNVVQGNVPSSAATPEAQTLRDEDKLNNLNSTGAGVSQIHNPFLRGLAKAADVVGTVFLPGLSAAIPGTNLHHQLLVNQAQQNLTNDQAVQENQAKIQQQTALAQQEEAKASALSDPQKAVDPSKTVTTDDGVYQLNPQTGKYDIRVGDRIDKPKPIEQQAYEFALSQGKNPLDAYNAVYNAKNQKADSLPQQYLDALSSGDQTKADLIKRTIQATQVQPKIDVHTATERPESTGTWTPGFDADKNPVMFNSKTGEIKPMSGTFNKPGANAKISSDEQKRADLAQNMNENIDALEDIAKRRPELFGPLAGRETDLKTAFGSSDPDIAKLQVIKHQLGMVAQGAHGMRSAQGVESAANALTNGYHNSPEALRAGLEAARQSVATFLKDSQNPGQARGTAPTVGTVENGYRFKGGDPSKQENWEKQ